MTRSVVSKYEAAGKPDLFAVGLHTAKDLLPNMEVHAYETDTALRTIISYQTMVRTEAEGDQVRACRAPEGNRKLITVRPAAFFKQ
jgi:hypothetical protein